MRIIWTYRHDKSCERTILHKFKQVSKGHPSMTRQQLRDLAKTHNVKRGRNTDDTIRNLLQAGISLSPLYLSTVNVIEGQDGEVNRLTAWPDTVVGNQEAEKYFRQRVKEIGDTHITDEMVSKAVEDGQFSNEMGTVQVYLVHSNCNA